MSQNLILFAQKDYEALRFIDLEFVQFLSVYPVSVLFK